PPRGPGAHGRGRRRFRGAWAWRNNQTRWPKKPTKKLPCGPARCEGDGEFLEQPPHFLMSPKLCLGLVLSMIGLASASGAETPAPTAPAGRVPVESFARLPAI